MLCAYFPALELILSQSRAYLEKNVDCYGKDAL